MDTGVHVNKLEQESTYDRIRKQWADKDSVPLIPAAEKESMHQLRNCSLISWENDNTEHGMGIERSKKGISFV